MYCYRLISRALTEGEAQWKGLTLSNDCALNISYFFSDFVDDVLDIPSALSSETFGDEAT